MRSAAALTILFSIQLTHAAVASSFDYSFNGVLADHFTLALPNPNSALIQNDVAARLEYSVPGGHLFSENGTGLAHLHFSPSYEQAWRAEVDATLPASYDTSFLTTNPANQNPDGDSWLEVGMLAFSEAAEDELFVVSLALEPAGPNNVERIFLATDESVGTDHERTTSEVDARLAIEFDPARETLSAFAGGIELFTSVLGPLGSNWEMAGDDKFSIVLFGSTGYQEVRSSDPLILDNFSAAIIPEPSTNLLAFIAATGFAFRRL